MARYRDRVAGEQILGTLDYIYAPSSDVARDVAWFADVLGAEVRFAIEDEGVRVAMLRLGDGPPLLVTDHLPDDRPVFLYRVTVLADASAALTARGWSSERSIDLPMGPAITFQAPGGVRLAIYEPSRSFVVDSFIGRRDF
jgi:hypothetical protein